MKILLKTKIVASTSTSTSFSEFMRTASSRRRKQVYRIVLQKASESQNDIIERAQDLETQRV